MKVDSLDALESAFAGWRQRKRYVCEATPEKLLARARRASKKHGVAAVVRVTGIDRSLLFGGRSSTKKARGLSRKKSNPVRGAAPTFSRLELSTPSGASPRPIAEVETVTGVKLRLFEETPEMVGLFSAVCGFGGAS